jgi:hypothetical protein
MPTPLPSSFASAAAGNTQDAPSRRGDGTAGGEWYAIMSYVLGAFPVNTHFHVFSFSISLPADVSLPNLKLSLTTDTLALPGLELA